MGTSFLIVFLGMLVPVLAAAPFYIADRRDGRRSSTHVRPENSVPEQDTAEPEPTEEVNAPQADDTAAVESDDSDSTVWELIPEAREAADDGGFPELVESSEPAAETERVEAWAQS